MPCADSVPAEVHRLSKLWEASAPILQWHLGMLAQSSASAGSSLCNEWSWPSGLIAWVRALKQYCSLLLSFSISSCFRRPQLEVDFGVALYPLRRYSEVLREMVQQQQPLGQERSRPTSPSACHAMELGSRLAKLATGPSARGRHTS